MKKLKIFFIISLLFILSFSTFLMICSLISLIGVIQSAIEFDELNRYISPIISFSSLTFLSLIQMVLSLTMFILLTPNLFRKSNYANLYKNIVEEWAKNKQARLAARAAKAEANKQKQIAELEQKLDELKQDNPNKLSPPPA